ncbi:MAG: hypothetical protein DWQ02_19165 [Bacteroidetes bacterium]|nr:MAG: hypothetical protein DWQ02_19165 [Bacteroidota bacterium]
MNRELDQPSGWTTRLGQNPAEITDFYTLERQLGKTVEMVCFSLNSGNQRSFSTALFEEIQFQPDQGVAIYGHLVNILIVGRRLQPLFQGLTLRRVKEVKEFSAQEWAPEDLFIEKIRIHSDYGEG